MGTTEDDDVTGDIRGSDAHTQPCMVRAAWHAADFKVGRGAVYGFRPVRTLPVTFADAGAPDGGAKGE